MKNSLFHRKFFALVLVSIAVFSAAAENFRVRKVISLQVPQSGESRKAVSGISDAIFLTLPQDMTFISGVELTFKIPEVIALWRDSVAYVFYENVSPEPSAKNVDYYGEKFFLKTIPPKLSLTLNIPLSADFPIKDSPYSVNVPPVPDYKKGIFVRFQQVMKGVPESLENAELEIIAKPILRNKGILSLKTEPEQSEEKKYSVYIDDKPEQKYDKMMLDTGEHHLSILSENYRNETRTFRIEQGKTTSLEISLKGTAPIFKIVCPASADVTIDGAPYSNTKDSIEVSAGEHTVKFSLGDYEITRNINAVNGHSYTISLDISASVSEE